MLYFIIGLFSTTIGSIVGIGGGLIIRPLLANMGTAKHLASFTSSIVVLSMAIVTLLNYKRNGVKLDIKRIFFLTVGNILGGFAGGSFIKYVDDTFINIAYIFMLVLILVSVIFREKLPKIKVTNPFLAVFIGIITGGLSGFFGIGGGPFQVTALIIFFALNPKEAAVDSIFITFFTTISSLAKYTIDGYMDFSLGKYMIPAAIIGGYIGSTINRKISEKRVAHIFNISVFAIIINQVVVLIAGK